MWGPGAKSVHLGEAEFCAQSIELVKRAQDEQVPLRILGAMAVYIHSSHRPEVLARYRALERLGPGRPLFTDLDTIGILSSLLLNLSRDKVESFMFLSA